MNVKTAAIVVLAHMVCFGGSLMASDDPPLRDELTYATHPSGMVAYEVTVEVGQGDGAETYKGLLRYERDAPDRPGSWMVIGSLSASPSPPQVGRRIELNRQSLLNPVTMTNSRFEIDTFGKITSASGESQLNLLLGDFTKWGIWPLPANSETEWQVSEPIMVQQIEGDHRFGNLPIRLRRSPFNKERLSAGMETTSYKITGTEGPITVIEHTYELKATFTDPPLTLTGKGTGRFDRKRGVFDHLQWTRQVVSIQNGAEVRLPVHVTLRRDDDFGLIPLTEEEKAARKQRAEEAKARAESPEAIAAAEEARQRAAEAMADAKRRMEEHKKQREAEASAPFDAQERKAWIAVLNAGKEYGDGAPIYGKLNGRTPRPDPELAKAIYEFANRMNPPSLATMFWDLAAKFDTDFASVLELRKAYGNSHTDLPDVGQPVPKTTKLEEGHLVAVKQKHTEKYRAKLVVSQDESGKLFVSSIGSKAIEQVPLEDVRAPSGTVMPYLPEQQRFPPAERTADSASESVNQPASSETRTWTDRSGRYSMKGRFISLKDDVVRLERADGTTVDIAIEKLRDADAQVARELAAAADDPFRVVTP